MQLKPCEEWSIHGFPSITGEGWVDSARHSWDLDLGGLGARVFLQGVEPMYHEWEAPEAHEERTSTLVSSVPSIYPGPSRKWVSIEIGAEQMFSDGNPHVRWEVQDWDIVVPAAKKRMQKQAEVQ